MGRRNTTVPEVDEQGDLIVPTTVVSASSDLVHQAHKIIGFRGRAMVLVDEPFPHFVPMHRDRFERLAYPILGGISRSRMSDILAYLASSAEDLSDAEHLIGFGTGTGHLDVTSALETTDPKEFHSMRPKVWNTKELGWEVATKVDDTVWRSPYVPVPMKEGERIPFIMSLAGGDTGKYDDIMQSIAPLVMDKKPDGVVWWVGDGANGKSTLMDALYRIFPGQLSSITVKRLVDGRDTPGLNGTLANIVKESSEGRVDDTEVYKSIGTHENFRVHKFHSQDDIEIRGNMHHIFSANSIPIFNDKGFSARRRTFIVPFTQRFASDPTFEARTFTPVMFGQLIWEMTRYAKQLRKQQYRYKFSADTMAAKLEYDTEANNAEEYARHIISEGVVAFDSFQPAKLDYENWCAGMGYVPLGLNNLRRALTSAGFGRTSTRTPGGSSINRYTLATVKPGEIVALGMGRPGLYTTPGFQPEAPAAEKTKVPDFEQPAPENQDEGPAPTPAKIRW